MGPTRAMAFLALAAGALTLAVFLVRTASDWPGSWPNDLEPWKNPKLDILVQTGLWWGGVCALVLLVVLLATSRAWMRALPGKVRPAQLPPVRFETFWLPVAAAMLATGILTWPRLSVSLNGDELYNARRYVMGSFELDKQQKPVFKATDWQDAFFENRGADNHVPFTVASRLSLGTWRAMAGTNDRHFSEVAMRLPAWVAGILAVGALAVCLWVAGYPSAGVVAAFLAAVHPWLLRYATEAAGYVLSALWIPLVCAAAILALRTGRWTWWLSFAGGLAALLYSVLSAGAVAFVLVAGLFVAILVCARRPGALPMQFRRLCVAVALALIPLALLLGPGAYQIARYLVVDRVDQVMGTHWLVDSWGQLALGMPWFGKGFESHLILTVDSLAAGGENLPWLVAIGVGAAALAGAARLLGSRMRERVVLAVVSLLSGIVFYGIAEGIRSYLLPRYIFFALPGVLLLAGLGLDWLSSLLARKVPGAVAGMPTVLALVLFAVATHPQRSVVMAHAKEDLKGVSNAIHAGADPLDVPSSQVLRGHVWSSISHYDPWSRNTTSGDALLVLMREALNTGIPLYYSFGYRSRALTEAPVKAAVDLAENPLLFDRVATFPGLEQDQFTHRLFKFRGEAARPHMPMP